MVVVVARIRAIQEKEDSHVAANCGLVCLWCLTAFTLIEMGGCYYFFLYDSIKILILLFIMISVVGFLRTFLQPAWLKEWLTKRKTVSHILASLFGAVTPFCSCSSIPIFFWFLKRGYPTWCDVFFSYNISHHQ